MSFIIVERTSLWAAAFRRELRKGSGGVFAAGNSESTPLIGRENSSRPRFPLQIQELRSVPHCQRELESSPYSAVALEVLPQNIAAVAKALSDWSHRFPHARFLALASRGLEPQELLLREAGAIHVTYSPRTLSPLLRLIRRQLARAPKSELTLEEAVWSGLPWG
ncbi:MAG: hypothetical protein K8R36_23465 [Planctomycetales bacterium]|nr:hypothetical protein [Planctomycetales bacterium]